MNEQLELELMSLAPFEKEVLDRLAEGPNPLGWRPIGRDKDGVALLRCEVSAGGRPGKRVCIIRILPTGLENHERFIAGG